MEKQTGSRWNLHQVRNKNPRLKSRDVSLNRIIAKHLLVINVFIQILICLHFINTSYQRNISSLTANLFSCHVLRPHVQYPQTLHIIKHDFYMYFICIFHINHKCFACSSTCFLHIFEV